MPTPLPVRRLVVKGCSGAGKSTLARALADALDLPWIELDAHHWIGPGWRAATPDDLRTRIEALLTDDRGWIVDGNYDSKLGELVVARAELIVWLDLPLWLKLGRLLRRSVRRLWHREALWNGNRESFLDQFWGRESLFAWALRTHVLHRRSWPEKFAGARLVRLTSPAEVDRWFAEISASSTGTGRASGSAS